MTAPSDDSLTELFEAWASTDVKVQILVFFRHNPGVVETMDGLALRLGVNPDALRDPVKDHVELGLLKKRSVGDKVVIMYDRRRHQDLERVVEDAIRERMDGGRAS